MYIYIGCVIMQSWIILLLACSPCVSSVAQCHAHYCMVPLLYWDHPACSDSPSSGSPGSSCSCCSLGVLRDAGRQGSQCHLYKVLLFDYMNTTACWALDRPDGVRGGGSWSDVPMLCVESATCSRKIPWESQSQVSWEVNDFIWDIFWKWPLGNVVQSYTCTITSSFWVLIN